jgi:hypothetical protein
LTKSGLGRRSTLRELEIICSFGMDAAIYVPNQTVLIGGTAPTVPKVRTSKPLPGFQNSSLGRKFQVQY